jgi:hypothetical protein
MAALGDLDDIIARLEDHAKRHGTLAHRAPFGGSAITFNFGVGRWYHGLGVRSSEPVLELESWTYYDFCGTLIYVGDVNDPEELERVREAIAKDAPPSVSEMAYGVVEPTGAVEAVEVCTYRKTVRNRKGELVPIEVIQLPTGRNYGVGPVAFSV